MRQGFVKVAAVTPKIRVAAPMATRPVPSQERPNRPGMPMIMGRMSSTATMPNTPILVMIPERGPDTEEGAAGWASGSQECRGTRPVFTPKPARQSTNAPCISPNESEGSPSNRRPGSMNSAPPAHIT